jgi:hypothetical protein
MHLSVIENITFTCIFNIIVAMSILRALLQTASGASDFWAVWGAAVSQPRAHPKFQIWRILANYNRFH